MGIYGYKMDICFDLYKANKYLHSVVAFSLEKKVFAVTGTGLLGLERCVNV